MNAHAGRSSGRGKSRSWRPLLERLEDRLAPAIFTVNTTADENNGIGVGGVSLREAIAAANSNLGPDFIEFNIPASDPGFANGVWTIKPKSALPIITDTVKIDGTSQPGWAVGAPVIQLNGINAGVNVSGLVLADHEGSEIRGLVINRFKQNGIDLLEGGQHWIAGNFIGTDPTGTKARRNGDAGLFDDDGDAVFLSNSHENVIGGANAADRNLLSGNFSDGVDIRDGSSMNRVVGNYIGTDITGTKALGNLEDGVFLQEALGNVIGSTISGEGNLISANGYNGIFMLGSKTLSTIVEGNLIGTDKDGNDAGLGNSTAVDFGDGIFMAEGFDEDLPAGPSFNEIRFNTIRLQQR